MKLSVFVTNLVTSLALPILASTPAAAQPAAPVAERGAHLGAELSVLPIGTLHAAAGNDSASADAVAALGIGAVLQYQINPLIALDLAPRVVFNVKAEDDADSATELDLRVRLTAGGQVAPGVRVYGAVAPGYSVVFLPEQEPVELPNPSGLIFGFGVGVAFKVAPAVTMTGEIGYQLGFQGGTFQGVDFDFDTRYLDFTAGVLFAL